MMMYFNIKSLKIKLLDAHDNKSQQGFKQSRIRKDTKLINFFHFLIDSTHVAIAIRLAIYLRPRLLPPSHMCSKKCV